MKKRIILKRWLCLMLVVLLLTGCAGNSYDERKPKNGTSSEVTPNEKKDTPTPVPDTPTPAVTDTPTPEPDTPTPVPDTPTPTQIPDTPTPTPIPDTPTPTIAESTPTPVITETVPTPTPLSFASAEEEQAAFDKFLEDAFVSMMGTNHLTLHFRLEHPEAYGIEVTYELEENEYDNEKAYQDFRAACEGVYSFHYENLTDAQKVNYDRLTYELELSERYRSIDYTCVNNYLMASNNNAVEGVMSALCEYPFVEDKDYDDFLKDIEACADYLDVLFKEMKHLCEIGACPSQDMYDTTMDNLNDLCKKDNIILAAFRANAADAGMDAATIEKRAEEVNQLIQEKLIPEAEKLRENVKTLEDYVQKPKGLASREGGKEYYAFLAQGTTGSNLSIDDMYTYLDGKISGLIDTYRRFYLKDMDCLKRYKELDYDTKDFVTILDRLKVLTAKDFPAIRDTKYTVSELADELCVDGILAYFLVPQADNPDRKVIRVNPKNKSTNVEMFSTLAHEGYPGHLYQNEFFRHTDGYNIINAALSYTGYDEGWATMMGQEAYLWVTEGDEAVAFLCDFDSLYSNSVVAVCDIGVNYYNWGIKELRSYLGGTVYGDDASIAEYILEFVSSDPTMLLPYTYSHFQCVDIINELVAKGMTRMEAYEAFLTVGPASIGVLRKHLGLPDETK